MFQLYGQRHPNSDLQSNNLPVGDRGCHTVGWGLFYKVNQEQFWVRLRIQNRNYTALLLITSAADKHCWNKPLTSLSSKLDEKTFTLYIQRGESTVFPVTAHQHPAGSSFFNSKDSTQLKQSLSFPKGTLMNRQLCECSDLVQYFVWKSSFHILMIAPHHVHIQHCHSNSQNW